MEIASLAATCEGSTTEQKIENAIRLLSSTERAAAVPLLVKAERLVQSDMGIAGFPSEAELEAIQANARLLLERRTEPDRAGRILESAARDPSTGKVKRASLVLQVLAAANEPTTTRDHANRKFREWLQFDLDVHEIDIRESGKSFASIDEYASIYEVSSSANLIHSDALALHIIEGMLFWLSLRPEQQPRNLIRNPANGQIVSPRSHGATRNEVGRFSRPD
ncbi:MAG: hypothetical protein EOP84_24905 [Verrucomicrobiaceae bacterium]|nr:MAG: hypothetical protein EOP84_24905 [Verrucomicrobiaceae bacterium]